MHYQEDSRRQYILGITPMHKETLHTMVVIRTCMLILRQEP